MHPKNFTLIIVWLLFFFPKESIRAQEYLYLSSFGNFRSATSFSITSAGIFYVTDSGTDEVYKIDSLGNVLKDAGGYGWDNGLFDNPPDVFANPLLVYVCDKNNHRVERFDKDLNFVSLLYTHDSDDKSMRFGYPLGCSVSQQGDLYILDSENKRIIKFDLFGNYIQNFGGYDAGNYSLVDPLSLALAPNGNIFVIDKKRIVIFDQYGNGLKIINEDNDFTGIRIIFNKLTINSKSEIYYSNLNLPDFTLTKIDFGGNDEVKKIVSSLIFNDKLYILTQTKIFVYQKTQ
ncbi:MAG: NHL repeat-containing protein [Ignavibacteriaceae bacterium]